MNSKDAVVDAIDTGRSIYIAVAIKRLRDEYKWSRAEVMHVSQELLDRLVNRMNSEVNTIHDDLCRMSALGRSDESVREMVISAFALAGAQESQSLEMKRRAKRN